MAKDIDLTLIEKNQVKQFVTNLTLNIQKLQNCNTRKELKEVMKHIENKLDNTPIDTLITKINNTCYE
jgi:hypothetical protein